MIENNVSDNTLNNKNHNQPRPQKQVVQ